MDHVLRSKSEMLKTSLLSCAISETRCLQSLAADNAAMQTFYSLLQKNALHRRRRRTRDELAYEIT